jgi:hypothetical protein
MNTGFDFREFTLLGDKVRSGKATAQEKDQFMNALYENGNLTKQQYEHYLKSKEKDEMVNLGLAVGGILLLGYLLSEVFSGKK